MYFESGAQFVYPPGRFGWVLVVSVGSLARWTDIFEGLAGGVGLMVWLSAIVAVPVALIQAGVIAVVLSPIALLDWWLRRRRLPSTDESLTDVRGSTSLE